MEGEGLVPCGQALDVWRPTARGLLRVVSARPPPRPVVAGSRVRHELTRSGWLARLMCAWTSCGSILSPCRRHQDRPNGRSLGNCRRPLLLPAHWTAFCYPIPNLEQAPAESAVRFLTLYFYSVGVLAGRRTARFGKARGAGASCGSRFGRVSASISGRRSARAPMGRSCTAGESVAIA